MIERNGIPLKRQSSKIIACLLAWVFALGSTAYGEALVLPEALTVIEEAAFAGDTSLSSVVLPQGIEEIGPRAFAASSVTEISIPAGIRRIAEDAFADVAFPLLLRTSSDSYGVQYALANQLDFRADTVCRALAIGQSNYQEGAKLNGSIKDAAAMAQMLSSEYDVTVRTDLMADQILTEIAQTFAGAKDSDISLFYYAGHGMESQNPEENGSLVGIDYRSLVTPAQLRAALDGVKGRKIVVIDACYSGSFIGRGESAAEEVVTEDPAAAFIRAFQTFGFARGGALTAQEYFVFAASAGDELSWETKAGGVFTGAFIQSKTSGDLNGDGVVTMQECYAYTSERVKTEVAKGGMVQNVQVYPENCNWFGVFR